MSRRRVVVVAGAGGFIGGHLVDRLRKDRSLCVRAVDIKPLQQWSQCYADVENIRLDLRYPDNCHAAVRGAHEVFNFAANMGGVGFLATRKVDCMLSVTLNANLIDAAAAANVPRYFFASSACVYPTRMQDKFDANPLREEDAYPAQPEDGYGWEKLFSERMCAHFQAERGIATRVARFHNVYGPHNIVTGDRAKAPAALCQKIISAKIANPHKVEIWGDGRQRRTFTYVADAVEGALRLMASEVSDPLNIGSDEQVSIDELVDRLEAIAGLTVERSYDLSAPRGVLARSSDNTRVRAELGWAPSFPLSEGLERLYSWMWGINQRQLPGSAVSAPSAPNPESRSQADSSRRRRRNRPRSRMARS